MKRIIRKIREEYPITSIAVSGAIFFAGLNYLTFNGGCDKDYKKIDVTLDNGDHAEVREHQGGITEVVLDCHTKIMEVSDGGYSVGVSGICSEYCGGITRQQAGKIYNEAIGKLEESRK